ncbi:hypothetical protein BK011_06855 [Tenericutes bacterium MZ-XQ]|nr:hypothetical protein BK011_06855 [Tenericutes bacterium MZ-XQ]
MTTENKLKDFILNNYKSLRDFSIKCDIPYTTVVSVINRGIDRAGINTIKNICNCLSIDINALAKGEIVTLNHINQIGDDFVMKYNILNDEGKERMELYLNDLLTSYKFTSDDDKKK